MRFRLFRTSVVLLTIGFGSMLPSSHPAAADHAHDSSSSTDFYLETHSCEAIPEFVLSTIRKLVGENAYLDINNTVVATFDGMVGNCWTGKEPDPAVEFNIDIHNTRVHYLKDKGGDPPELYLCGVSTMRVSAGADPVVIIHLPNAPAGLSQHDCVEVIVKTLPRAVPGGDDPLGRVYYH